MTQEYRERTATQINIEEEQKLARERALHARLRWFNGKWQPKDPQEAAEFYADLTMLIQELHRDANKEVVEAVRVAMTMASSRGVM